MNQSASLETAIKTSINSSAFNQNPPYWTAWTAVILLVLLLFGIAYALIVRRLRRRSPDHGHTAWLVVVGDAAIVLAFGLLAGVDSAILLIACMTAAGLPMVVEYLDDQLPAAGLQRTKLDL